MGMTLESNGKPLERQENTSAASPVFHQKTYGDIWERSTETP
jgi:hypothetical protein